MKKIIILAIAAIITLGANAQQSKTASKNEQTVTIQTNGVCQKCADKFKENVPYFKGVKSYTYDMKTAKLTINYDAKKTNPDQLRTEVSKLGYNADNVKADPDARAKLPACCRAEKSGGCGGCAGHGNGQGCGNHGAQKSCAGHAANGGHSCGNHGDQHKCQGQHGGEKSCAGHAANGGHSCGNHEDQHKCQGQHGGEKSCAGHPQHSAKHQEDQERKPSQKTGVSSQKTSTEKR